MDLERLLLAGLIAMISLPGRLRTFLVLLIRVKYWLVYFFEQLLRRKFFPEQRQSVLEKVPKHVAISMSDYYDDLDDTDGGESGGISLPDLARVTYWCGKYGVEKVSIYDWRGVVARPANTRRLADLVLRQRGSDQQCLLIVNGVTYDDGKSKTIDDDEDPILRAHQRNGHHLRRTATTLELVTLDWNAGRRGIVKASRSLAAAAELRRKHRIDGTTTSFSGNNNNNDHAHKMKFSLTDYLAEECGVVAPDLVVEFGGGNVGDSTCGFPVLALRVAEIVRVAQHRNVDEFAIVECLEKYSRRDRRFGK